MCQWFIPFYVAETYSAVCIDHDPLTQSPIDGWLACFLCLAIVNKAARKECRYARRRHEHMLAFLSSECKHLSVE